MPGTSPASAPTPERTRWPTGPSRHRAGGSSRLPEREAAIDRLRAWVEQIYQPGYGHLAAALPPCWDRHPLCLFTLDWLSELWSVLYLSPDRTATTLAAQAEWQTRLLPAAATQMTHEAAHCQHGYGNVRYPPTRRPQNGLYDSRKENAD